MALESLFEAADSAAQKLLERVTAEDGDDAKVSLTERVKAFSAVVAYIESRTPKAPPKPLGRPKGKGGIDALRERFHSDEASRRAARAAPEPDA